MAVFGDGHVQMLRDSTSALVLRALSTATGGETFNSSDQSAPICLPAAKFSAAGRFH